MNLTEIKSFWAQSISTAALKVTALQDNYQGLTAIVHNASWCPDCEREVSQLLALDAKASVGFTDIKLHSYEDKEVYKSRKASGDLAITCLPTLIFVRAGEEVLRIEEDSAGELQALLQQLK